MATLHRDRWTALVDAARCACGRRTTPVADALVRARTALRVWAAGTTAAIGALRPAVSARLAPQDRDTAAAGCCAPA